MVLFIATAALVARGAVRATRARERRRAAIGLAHDTVAMSGGVSQGIVRRALVPAGQSQPTPPAELRRQVQILAAGTYIADIIDEQDSALYRWPEHFTDALRVYIEPTAAIPDWDARYPEMAREVFGEWSQAGFPLRFTFIYDSASADITIHWIERFPPEEHQRIGVTNRIQTSAFQIAKANVLVANHDSSGRALSVKTVGGILRHEVGHARPAGSTSAGKSSATSSRE